MTSISPLFINIRERASFRSRFSADTNTRGFNALGNPLLSRDAFSPAVLFAWRAPFEFTRFRTGSLTCKLRLIAVLMIEDPLRVNIPVGLVSLAEYTLLG